MAKAKKEKMEANPFKLKKELPHLPGYIIVILWTAFIFCMIGWIILASLSTTKESIAFRDGKNILILAQFQY